MLVNRIDPIWIKTWRDISKALGVTVQTARKWSKKYGLPVHRLPGNLPAIIPGEVQLWLQNLGTPPPGEKDENNLKNL